DTVDDTVRMIQDAGFELEGPPVPAYVNAVVVIKAVKVREPVVQAAAAPPQPGDVIAALAGQASAPRSPAAGAPRPDVRDVFLSYSAEDKSIADEVRSYLEDQAIPCWISSR